MMVEGDADEVHELDSDDGEMRPDADCSEMSDVSDESDEEAAALAGAHARRPSAKRMREAWAAERDVVSKRRSGPGGRDERGLP